ncbi:MAG: flagellar basal body P-ring formation chaperone FlgA [Desulfobacterales bacterium]|jgi:flagella basal body P-ring formation protein FlgA
MSHAVKRPVFLRRYLQTLCRCAVVFVQLVFLIPVVPAADIAIMLRPEAEVQGPEIQLGEVAEIACAETELHGRLERLVIGKAPLPGRSRHITDDYVRLRLRQLDIGVDRMILGGADRIEVSVPGVAVSEEQIRQIVTGFVKASGIWGDAEVRVKELTISADRTLPRGRVTYRVLPPRHLRSQATLPLSIVFDVDDRFQKTIRATVRVEALAPVVVAARPIGRLKPISTDDLKMETMNLAELPAGVMTDADDIIGKRARRNIDAGDILRPDLIEMPPLVKRGDMVLIVAESGGIKVTATGEVKSDGLRGDQVKVVNLGSKKRFSARVVDQKTVMVDF